jgi:dienelactone hydrolase
MLFRYRCPSTRDNIHTYQSQRLVWISKRYLFGGYYIPPPGESKFPLVIFNHGATGFGRTPTSLTIPYNHQAKFFLNRGFVVIAPMRKGRGQSEGSYSESEERTCNYSNWYPGIESAIEDVNGVIDYAATLPYVDSSRIIISGESRGGFLSVAYAAKGAARAQVKGVINFVGGWVGTGSCPMDFNHDSYSEFGTKTNLRMLWLYAENDSYYPVTAISGYVDAFTTAGGQVDFKLYRGIKGNGHGLARVMSVWETDASKYLDSIDFINNNQ